MSLESALAGLRRDIAQLQDAVSALRVTVMEDRPARGRSCSSITSRTS